MQFTERAASIKRINTLFTRNKESPKFESTLQPKNYATNKLDQEKKSAPQFEIGRDLEGHPRHGRSRSEIDIKTYNSKDKSE